MAAPALRVGSPRLQLLAGVSIRPSRRCSGLWGLVCLSIFVLLQINSKPSLQFVSQMDLGPRQVLAPWFLNDFKATKRRGAAAETLEQQVPRASTAMGAMAGVGWEGVCARPVMRAKLRHLQDLPQLSPQPEPEFGILAAKPGLFLGAEGGRADPTPTGGWTCRHVGSVVTGGVRAVRARAGVQPLPWCNSQAILKVHSCLKHGKTVHVSRELVCRVHCGVSPRTRSV